MPFDDLIKEIRRKLYGEQIMSDDDIIAIALKCVIVCQNNEQFEAALILAVTQYALQILEEHGRNNNAV